MNLFRLKNYNSRNHKFTERALAFIPLVLVCFTLSPTARAADGGLPGFNTAEGVGALSSLTTGTANTGLGENALMSLTSGNNNTATGSGALFSSSTSSNNTGSFNTAVGGGALLSNTTGGFNTAIGQGALRNNNGDDNTATGYQALF